MSDRAQLMNDPEVAMRAALDGRQAQIWTALPGIVTAVNLADNTVDVQPAIQGQVTDEQGKVKLVNYPKLIHCPVQFPRAGGFSLTLPVAVGDEVLIVWACRCIDAWWQSGGIQRPMEARMHDLSDGFALLGFSSKPNAIANVSATGAQLRNEDGTTYVELSADGKIKLVSPTEIDLTGPIKMTGAVDITGSVTVSGTVGATDFQGPGGINLTSHRHGGVQTGGGTSGGPVP